LRALGQHGGVGLQPAVKVERSLGDVGRELAGVVGVVGGDGDGVEAGGAVDAVEGLVDQADMLGHAVAQALGVEQQLGAQAAAGGLVGVGRADAAPSGADFAFAVAGGAGGLFGLVERDVAGVMVGGGGCYTLGRDGDTQGAEPVDLIEQAAGLMTMPWPSTPTTCGDEAEGAGGA
jgi:hypothetical protein